MEKFSETIEIDRRAIGVDLESFQGRASEYSEASVKKIVSEGYDKSREPIVVFKKGEKYMVLSGHSRFEASRRLYEAGDKSLVVMRCKVFLGTEDEAKQYALYESNRTSDPEGLMSDVKAVKAMLQDKMTIEQMESYIRPKAYLNRLIDYTYLNPSGRIMEALASDSRVSYPYIERNAQWVAVLRKQIKALTDSHESELFDYLYKNGKTGLTLTKDKLYYLVERRAGSFDFNPSEPLNLANVNTGSALINPLLAKIAELGAEVDALRAEVVKYQQLIGRAKVEGASVDTAKFQANINNNNARILNLLQKKLNYEYELKKTRSTVVNDLFTEVREEAVEARQTEAISNEAEGNKAVEIEDEAEAAELEEVKRDPCIIDVGMELAGEVAREITWEGVNGISWVKLSERPGVDVMQVLKNELYYIKSREHFNHRRNVAGQSVDQNEIAYLSIRASQVKQEIEAAETVKKQTEAPRTSLEQVLKAIEKLSGLRVEIVGSWLWVSGKTKENKEELKRNGLRFSSSKKMWYWREVRFPKRGEPVEMDRLRAMFGSRVLVQGNLF